MSEPPGTPDTPDPPGSPFPGLPDLGGLMDQLQRVQEAQAQVYEGQAGGGAVKVTADGTFQFRSVTIAPDAVDPDDVEMLQDLVLAALHDLTAQLAEAQRAAMGGFDPSALGEAFGGLGLGPPPQD
jgi:DNA-binding YbaB/EbfC family protein